MLLNIQYLFIYTDNKHVIDYKLYIYLLITLYLLYSINYA